MHRDLGKVLSPDVTKQTEVKISSGRQVVITAYVVYIMWERSFRNTSAGIIHKEG